MKKNYTLKFGIFLFAIALLWSCGGGDDSPAQSVATAPSVLTSDAQPVNATTFSLEGNLISNGNSEIFELGFYYGTNPNLTTSNSEFISTAIIESGSFSEEISGLLPNTQYYFRSFAQNIVGQTLGNVMSFSTGALVMTEEPTEILTTSVLLKGISSNTGLNTVGFVYGTTQNPTINNGNSSVLINGTSPYQIQISGLTSNTTYYVRSYLNLQGNISYGEQKQFKTTGYFGPGGGYVFYDKGVTQDAWRYMEIHPETLSYNVSQTTGSQWGSTGFISGTFPAFGTGLDNSNTIANSVTQANCAAKLCLNATINGKSDWFLPSSQELLVAAKSLHSMGVFLANQAWTSTQTDATYANTLSYSSPPPTFSIFTDTPKTFSNVLVLPVRRF